MRKIPDRMLNMAGNERDAGRMENDIYSFIDVGILVRRRGWEDSMERYQISRYIDQVCFFSREDGKNQVQIVVEDGKVISDAWGERKGTYYEAKVAMG